MPRIKFQDSSIRGSQVSQLPSITDRQTEGQTQTNMPPQLLHKVGGITNPDGQTHTHLTKIVTAMSRFTTSRLKDIVIPVVIFNKLITSLHPAGIVSCIIVNSIVVLSFYKQ